MAHQEAACQGTVTILQGHMLAVYKLNSQSLHCQHFRVTHAAGYIRDTFEALIVNNTSLSNVQKFHYLIASLKNEAKDLIINLQITNENFLVA